MARKSVVERSERKVRKQQKYRARYESIKKELQQKYAKLLEDNVDYDAVYEEIEVLQTRLEKEVPRSATRKQLRNRCKLTGRSRGVYRRFQLGRNMLRKLAMDGLIPGLHKASW